MTFPAVRTTVLSQEKLALARAPVVSAEALAEASRDAKQAAVRGSIVILDGTPQHVRAIAREAAALHPPLSSKSRMIMIARVIRRFHG